MQFPFDLYKSKEKATHAILFLHSQDQGQQFIADQAIKHTDAVKERAKNSEFFVLNNYFLIVLLGKKASIT